MSLCNAYVNKSLRIACFEYIESCTACHSRRNRVDVIVFFGKLATDPLAIALIADNSPRNQLSTAFGIFNFVGMSSAIVAPYATGLLRDITGSWNSGFYVAVALLLTGIVVVLCIDERKRIS